jgi:pyruvate ferredoxin oxidoreductase gamma subunit/2-oxoisovalerate ferredoxin oxidoreductase gamma subunit
MPLVNTTILGAFPKLTHTLSIGSVLDAIREHIPSRPEENAKAALEAYESLDY